MCRRAHVYVQGTARAACVPCTGVHGNAHASVFGLVGIVSSGYQKPSARQMEGKLQRLPDSVVHDVHRHVLCGALPLWPGEIELDLRRRIRCLPNEEEEYTTAAHWIEKLVVLGALLEQSPLTSESYEPPERTCIDTFAVSRALNWCDSVRSIQLDMGDWPARAFPDGKLCGQGPSFRPAGPVDRWFAKPPASWSTYS